MDCKATVKLGPFSRGGKTRGEYKASDHDFGGTEHYIPCGILDEETAQLSVTFGSSAKTSDFIVDTLALTLATQPAERLSRLSSPPEPAGTADRNPASHAHAR